MPEEDAPSDEMRASRFARALRFDSLIAVSALLISSLTAGASWWQTRVIQEQLSAQVWPYVSVSEDFNGSAISVGIANNGLGPAILESASLSIDGKSQPNFIQAMHVILGPGLMARKPKNEKLGLTLSSEAPGSVIRPGDSNTLFSLTSKHYAPLLLRASRRIDIRVCYCAILPNTCWLQDESAVASTPQPVRACDEIRDDLLHASTVDELTEKF